MKILYPFFGANRSRNSPMETLTMPIAHKYMPCVAKLRRFAMTAVSNT